MAHEMRRADEADDLDVLPRDGPDRDPTLQPLAKPLSLGNIEVHVGEFARFRIALAVPDQEGTRESGNGPLTIVRAIASEPFAIRDGDIHARGCPVLRAVFACPNRDGGLKRGN